MTRVIVASTDVSLHEKRHDKGTEFEVVDPPKPDQTPPQVGSATARMWLRESWATEKAPGKAAK